MDRKNSSAPDVSFSSYYKDTLTNTQSPKANDFLSRKTLVFDDPVYKRGFTQVSNIVLRDPLVSLQEKALYCLLLSYAWQDRECFPGQDKLAKDAGCTARTIRTLLDKLQKRKLIKIERPGLNKPNIYHICRLNDGYLPVQFIDKGNDR